MNYNLNRMECRDLNQLAIMAHKGHYNLNRMECRAFYSAWRVSLFYIII